MPKTIPIITCIDLEPDHRVLDPKNPLPWKGYEQCYDFFHSMRPEIAKATGAPCHFSWFFRMDPQVAQVYGSAGWGVEHAPQKVEDLKNHGDEIGLHNHCFRWNESLNTWVVDHGDQDWTLHCIRFSLTAYQQVFGKKCESFRFGERWISNEAVALLEKSGVRFELTLEPGQEGLAGLSKDEIYTGFIPDFSTLPRTPYIPKLENFREPDPHRRDGIWMIPLSTGELRGLSGLALKLFRRLIHGFRFKQTWGTLYLLLEPLLFRQVAEDLLNTMTQPYLALLTRSDAPLKPYYFRNMKKNLNYLLSHPRVKDFVFSTPQEAMASLNIIPKEKHIARSA